MINVILSRSAVPAERRGRISHQKASPYQALQQGKPNMTEYYVYIMTNPSQTLYTGVTNGLQRRVHTHKTKAIPGFASQYNITQMAYYEGSPSRASAIAREKQIKGWLRRKNLALIEPMNPRWRDFSDGRYGP